jgi:thiol:disulfide interchange protein
VLRKTKVVVAAAALLVVASAGAGVTYGVLHRGASAANATASGNGTASGDECETVGKCEAKLRPGQAPAEKPKGPRILQFSSASCVACKRMAPVVAAAERACAAAKGVTHVDVDGDDGAALAATYAVSSIPAWLSIDADGNEVSRIVGVQPEWRIQEAIEEVSGTRCDAVDLGRPM